MLRACEAPHFVFIRGPEVASVFTQVIDANRARPQLWRRPVERLSALAISVLLADGHEVIGVVGKSPNPPVPRA